MHECGGGGGYVVHVPVLKWEVQCAKSVWMLGVKYAHVEHLVGFGVGGALHHVHKEHVPVVTCDV